MVTTTDDGAGTSDHDELSPIWCVTDVAEAEPGFERLLAALEEAFERPCRRATVDALPPRASLSSGGLVIVDGRVLATMAEDVLDRLLAQVEGVAAVLLGGDPTSANVAAAIDRGGLAWADVAAPTRAIVACAAALERARTHASEVTLRRELVATVARLHELEPLPLAVAGIRHDLANLLGAVTLQCTLIKGAEVAPELLADVEAVSELADHALGVLGRLSVLLRPGPPELELVELSRFVNDSLPVLRRMVGPDVQIVVDLARGLPPVLADRTELDRVLLNLAVNARDAMARKGHLALRTRGDGEHRVVLEVSDTGPGIDPRIRDRIFTPHATTSGDSRRGIGLAIVAKVVEDLGGTIEVRCPTEGGTRFEIALPLPWTRGIPRVTRAAS